MDDPLRVTVALVPLIVYSLILGALNLGKKPFLTTIARDTVALGLALSGLMLIGPAELMAPEAATARFGAFIWVMLATLYSLLVSLVVLMQRPGLVIYNLSLEEFREPFLQVVKSIEPNPQWAGNTLALPGLGIELHVESFPVMRNIKLSSVGDLQNLHGWRTLETTLAGKLSALPVRSSPIGIGFVTLGILMAIGLVIGLSANHETLVQEIEDFIRPTY